MNKVELAEGVATLKACLIALSAAAKGNTGTAGANLAFAVSGLAEDASAALSDGTAGGLLAACFDDARLAGASYAAIRGFYLATAALAPSGVPAKAVIATCCNLALVQIGKILASTEFKSRDDVDRTIHETNEMFEAAELLAGRSLSTSLYRAIVTLHAAVTADLTQRSYPLPRLVTYAFPKTFGALALAHRLYGDASRAEEIAGANAVFNPAFMPQSGEVLSA